MFQEFGGILSTKVIILGLCCRWYAINFLYFALFQVFWMKDGVEINAATEINFIISSEGNLLINQARLDDSGNYTCGAQNLATRRLSESATLTVYGTFSIFFSLL